MIAAQRPDVRPWRIWLRVLPRSLRRTSSLKPTVWSAFRDVRDQTAEAGFRTTLRRVPVSGIAFADVTGATARVGSAFDNLQSNAAGILRLLQNQCRAHLRRAVAGASCNTRRTMRLPRRSSGTVRAAGGVADRMRRESGRWYVAGPQGRVFKALIIRMYDPGRRGANRASAPVGRDAR